MTSTRRSLRRRVAVGGFLLISILVLALDVFVYLSLRDALYGNLSRTVHARAQLAAELGADLEPDDLRRRLSALGLRADITTPDGEVLRAQPVVTRFDALPPAGRRTDAGSLTRTVTLSNGGRVTVHASRGGVETTLQRVLLLQLVGTAGVLAAAAFVLGRMTTLALRPLDEIVRTARRIGGGGHGERLPTDRADTELGQVAEAFNEMLDQLAAALDEAQVSEERSRRFLADAAHQLRTPITAMRTSVGALVRERSPEQRERLFDDLVKETARTSRLLASLLRIARLDAGELPQPRAVDVVTVVSDEVDRVRALSPSVRVRATAPHGPIVVDGDEEGLREALANLLDNARRHARRTIGVAVDLEVPGEVAVAVSDDGPGVAAGDEEVIFERFVSLDGGGSGLGLPIARAVARAHGGDLLLRNGSFVLQLPRRVGASEPAAP